MLLCNATIPLYIAHSNQDLSRLQNTEKELWELIQAHGDKTKKSILRKVLGSLKMAIWYQYVYGCLALFLYDKFDLKLATSKIE